MIMNSKVSTNGIIKSGVRRTKIYIHNKKSRSRIASGFFILTVPYYSTGIAVWSFFLGVFNTLFTASQTIGSITVR